MANNNFPFSKLTVRPELVEGQCGSTSSPRTDSGKLVLTASLSNFVVKTKKPRKWAFFQQQLTHYTNVFLNLTIFNTRKI